METLLSCILRQANQQSQKWEDGIRHSVSGLLGAALSTAAPLSCLGSAPEFSGSYRVCAGGPSGRASASQPLSAAGTTAKPSLGLGLIPARGLPPGDETVV